MAGMESSSLLKSFLGFWVAQKPAETPAPAASWSTQASNAWARADAFLLHETDELDEMSQEQVDSALNVFEDFVEYDSDRGADASLHYDSPYPKLQAVRRMTQRSSFNGHSNSENSVRISKRKRENDAAIQQLSRMGADIKKRRVVPREDPSVIDDIEDPKADSAMLVRKHLVSLDNALRNHWICVCQKCSGMSVRLSLPSRKKHFDVETCFEVFFGVRSLLVTTLQEARITVKDVQDNRPRSASDPARNVMPEFANICKIVTESLDQQTCLHLALEDGLFKSLHPQPKTFGSGERPRTLHLSALFKRQQELRGGLSVLPLRGKRILAVTIATALLPFLETPWVQPSFDHSKIQFFQPLRGGELPNITKPFLAMEHIPIVSSNKTSNGNNQADSASSKHRVHPNASVLALGILLCELHYCTPVELMQTDPDSAQNVNTNYYTCLDILKNLEDDAGKDYYLATRACLQWEYYPSGEPTDFESASVQRVFYQKVIKRLENAIFQVWGDRLEDLDSLDSQVNEGCWGLIGREVFRQQTSKAESSATSSGERAGARRRASDNPSLNYTSNSSDVVLQMPAQLSWGFQNRSHLAESSQKSLYFFDASHQSAAPQDSGLSEKWMLNLQSSIYHHVDSFDTIITSGRAFEPVRIAILDSGFDPRNPLLMTEDQRLDPRIKDVRSFVHQTEPLDIQDEIGHGTHALGLLLKVATCAEIYIARIANRETLGRNSYDDIASAINHAVTNWKADVISMSFGIRENHEPMKQAISDALSNRTLMFAAASNDGANYGRAFPAKYPGVFCIHSTDGNGNSSAFNPTADEKDVNFSLLGEHVVSHWPKGKNGHDDSVNVMSGTSVATPIAAGLAASLLSFVRQQEQGMIAGSQLLGPWLKDVHSMDAVLNSMVRRRLGYDYIAPHILLDPGASRDYVYDKIKDLRRHMYD